jgi:hypothetical protein
VWLTLPTLAEPDRIVDTDIEHVRTCRRVIDHNRRRSGAIAFAVILFRIEDRVAIADAMLQLTLALKD